MIDGLEYADLIKQQIWLFDSLFGNLLDSPPLRSILLLGLVDGAICALAELLGERGGTLGLKS